MDYIGTDLKYAFSSTGAFDMVAMEWDMVFYVGSKSCLMTKRGDGTTYTLTCDQDNMGCKLNSNSDGWLFMLDSSYFGTGTLIAKLTAYIPDDDFDPTTPFPTLDATRAEVRRFNLDTIAQ